MKLINHIPAGSPVTHLHLHPGSALCATAGDDLTLRLFDIEAARLVRRFKGHRWGQGSTEAGLFTVSCTWKPRDVLQKSSTLSNLDLGITLPFAFEYGFTQTLT